MMKLYDKKKAVAFILRRVYLEEYQTLSRELLEPLIGQCVDADFDYMLACDIFRPDGSRGECFYNKENARRHILFALIKGEKLTDRRFDDLYKLVDDYLDFNLSYLEYLGLSYPTGVNPEERY